MSIRTGGLGFRGERLVAVSGITKLDIFHFNVLFLLYISFSLAFPVSLFFFSSLFQIFLNYISHFALALLDRSEPSQHWTISFAKQQGLLATNIQDYKHHIGETRENTSKLTSSTSLHFKCCKQLAAKHHLLITIWHITSHKGPYSSRQNDASSLLFNCMRCRRGSVHGEELRRGARGHGEELRGGATTMARSWLIRWSQMTCICLVGSNPRKRKSKGISGNSVEEKLEKRRKKWEIGETKESGTYIIRT